MTYTEELALVDAAIASLLGSGQQVSYQGRTLTMADYETLNKRRDVLKKLVDGESGNRKFRNGVIGVTPQ